MNGLVLYIHGKGGTADEALHYCPLFPGYDVTGLDYKARTPWEAKEEFPPVVGSLRGKYGPAVLIANSIGAYFAMHALAGQRFDKAFLISPVVDMEKLILGMMAMAGVTEADLQKEKEIRTPSGETLTRDYLCYARAHPVRWDIPTEILYGEKDPVTSFETMSAFAGRIGAGLTVMKDGEHWFHTDAHMKFLDEWIARSL
ncbi:MAG: alpha/beta hydrolase [Mailhella sp.]|nr:alpha/beta hydrolase [Mailhella sp.]